MTQIGSGITSKVTEKRNAALRGYQMHWIVLRALVMNVRGSSIGSSAKQQRGTSESWL